MAKRNRLPLPSLDDSTLHHLQDSLFVDTATGMVLSRIGSITSWGYERAEINGKEQYVHRIVYEVVHGPLPKGMTVNHIDGVKLNNHPSNLEAATHSEQHAHAYRMGLRVGNGQTGKIKSRRVSDEDIQRLKDAPRGSIGELANELGIARSYAYQIRYGRLRRTDESAGGSVSNLQTDTLADRGRADRADP